MKQADRFCKCIKSVKESVKLRSGQRGEDARERAAIAICVKSILQRKGRTLKKFNCRKGAKLQTQTRKRT